MRFRPWFLRIFPDLAQVAVDALRPVVKPPVKKRAADTKAEDRSWTKKPKILAASAPAKKDKGRIILSNFTNRPLPGLSSAPAATSANSRDADQAQPAHSSSPLSLAPLSSKSIRPVLQQTYTSIPLSASTARAATRPTFKQSMCVPTPPKPTHRSPATPTPTPASSRLAEQRPALHSMTPPHPICPEVALQCSNKMRNRDTLHYY
ncbi:hypothetical protein FB451DRAFT_1201923 [Mycena latifolia]|nr:hypothetical protein FB451DRAFT_1201923 [Mycena latifolia]